MRRRALNFGFLTIALSLPGSCAWASVDLITSRAALAPNDAVKWSDLGLDFSSVQSPFRISTAGGIQLTVSQPVGGFEIYHQNPPAPHPPSLNSGWAGSFAPGDSVLYTADPGEGPIFIHFDSPVLGIGAQVESGQYGPYTAHIEAFDALGLRLGNFNMNGVSDDRADNSAVFVGLRSDIANIGSVRFSVDAADSQDLAINQLAILSDPGSNIVPEPAPCALLVLAFGVWIAVARRNLQR